MPIVRFIRFTASLALSVSLSVSLGLATVAVTEHDRSADLQPTATTYPTNAAKIFRWGNALVKDEFVTPLSPSRWLLNAAGAGIVRNQHGMLTLNTSPYRGSVMATLLGGDRQYGRWEARIRTRQYGATPTPYQAVFELISTGARYCGARDLVVSESTLGRDTATMHARNTPDADFTASRTLDLGQDVFHTYAVEVTPDHVSWFIDTRVVMTERRPAALAGETYRIRFRMMAPVGGTKVRSRMQMDWVRYYDLSRKSARPITAPPATLTAYPQAC